VPISKALSSRRAHGQGGDEWDRVARQRRLFRGVSSAIQNSVPNLYEKDSFRWLFLEQSALSAAYSSIPSASAPLMIIDLL
jgi:hypothetical protein